MEFIIQKLAASEGILARMSKGELKSLDRLISQTGDVQFWADVLRYENDIRALVESGIVSDDAPTLMKLREFGIETISPFHYAGMRGSEQVLRRGLQFGLNVNIGLGSGVTALHLAAFNGKKETVAQLVEEFQANVNIEDGRRWRPLHYASSRGHKEVVEFLVERGADVQARDFEGATAAYRARQHRHAPIVSCLLELSGGDGDILLLEQEDHRSTLDNTIPCNQDGSNPEVKTTKDTNFNAASATQASGESSTYTFVERRVNRRRFEPDKRGRLKVNEDGECPTTDESTSGQDTLEGLISVADNPAEDNIRSSRIGADGVKKLIREFEKHQPHNEEIPAPADSANNPHQSENSKGIECKQTAVEAAAKEFQVNVKLSKKPKRNNDYEEIDLSEEESSDATFSSQEGLGGKMMLPRIDLEDTMTNAKLPFSKRSKVDQYEVVDLPTDNNAQNEQTKTNAEISLFKNRSAHQYEEVDLPTDNNAKNEQTRTNAEKPLFKNRRPHQYEEIDLPTDSEQFSAHHSEQKRMTQLEQPTGPTEKHRISLATDLPVTGFRKREHHYEEIDQYYDAENEEVEKANVRRQKDMAPSENASNAGAPVSNYRRRIHPYEEVLLDDCDTSKTENHKDDETEEQIRRLIRNELEILNFDHASDQTQFTLDADRPADKEQNEHEGSSDSQSRLETVITLRQVQRILRQELRYFIKKISVSDPGGTNLHETAITDSWEDISKEAKNENTAENPSAHSDEQRKSSHQDWRKTTRSIFQAKLRPKRDKTELPEDQNKLQLSSFSKVSSDEKQDPKIEYSTGQSRFYTSCLSGKESP